MLPLRLRLRKEAEDEHVSVFFHARGTRFNVLVSTETTVAIKQKALHGANCAEIGQPARVRIVLVVLIQGVQLRYVA